MNFTPEEREAYEAHLKWIRIEANTLKKYKADGKEEGKEEGIKEGMEKGIQIGEARGEAKTKIEIAKKMLSNNDPISYICDLTGLSPEEISKL
jgi:predicted transposase/invertase (TIGR01784 family)